MEPEASAHRHRIRTLALGAIIVAGVVSYLAGVVNLGSYSQGPSFYFSVAGSLIASFLVLGLEPALNPR